MVEYYIILGYISSLLFACANIPQIFHTVKVQRADDISHIYQAVYLTAAICGLIFSLNMKLLNIQIGCSIEICTTVLLILLKLKYTNNAKVIPV
jgi:uncharacterized protein with PQ loop repeat